MEKELEFEDGHLFTMPALGFGTTRLGHHTNVKDALRTLETVFDQGIRYFDTAPIYDFGWAEKILGKFSEDKRDKMFIATKVGLESFNIMGMIPLPALNVMRKVVKSTASSISQSRPIGVKETDDIRFDSKKAIRSLEQSLKRLRTDFVDVLLLHEATRHLANSQEAIRFMENALASGKARSAGIGSTMAKIGDAHDLHPMYTFLQHEYSIMNSSLTAKTGRIVNTYGLMLQIKWIKEISNNKIMQTEILNASGLDMNKDADILNLCLSGVLYLHPFGIHLFSSMKIQHIQETVSTWNGLKISEQQFKEVISILRKYIQVQ